MHERHQEGFDGVEFSRGDGAVMREIVDDAPCMASSHNVFAGLRTLLMNSMCGCGTLRVLAARWSLRGAVTFAAIRAGFAACRSRKDERDRPGRRGRTVSRPFGRRGADRKRYRELQSASRTRSAGFSSRKTHRRKARTRAQALCLIAITQRAESRRDIGRSAGWPEQAQPVRHKRHRRGGRFSWSRIDSSSEFARRCMTARRAVPGRALVRVRCAAHTAGAHPAKESA